MKELTKETEEEIVEQIAECKRDLTEEQILWRKYGKGIQFDNIVHLKDRIYVLTLKLQHFEKK